MKSGMRLTIAALTFSALAACGGSKDDAKTREEKVFDPLIQTMDKAKAVEDTVMQQKEDLDEAMKKMEEGGEHRDKDQ